jgi:hypothetical protein
MKKQILILTALLFLAFQINSQDWFQKGIDIDGEYIDNQFGRSVALSDDGNTMVVGAANSSGNVISAGHVRVYNWSGTTWVQQLK